MDRLRPPTRTYEVIAGELRLVDVFDVPLRVGIVADTHCEAGALPPELLAGLDGCDLILHAGDIGSPYVLSRLGKIAPVLAVRGNHDRGPAFDALPDEREVHIGPWKVGMVHGHQPHYYDAQGSALARLAGRVDVGIYGHNHQRARVAVAGTWLVNPGSPAHPAGRHGSYALMEFGEDIALAHRLI